MALTPQSAVFYRDNYNLDDGVAASDSTMKYRALNAKANFTAQSSEELNKALNEISNAFHAGEIDPAQRDALRQQAREVQAQRKIEAEQLAEAVMAGDPNAIALAGQLWYEREAVPTLASEQAQQSGGGGDQASQPSQPESVPTAFMEASKNRPASSTQGPTSSSVVGGGGIVDLGGGAQTNNASLIGDANKLLFTPSVNAARPAGLIASSNPQLYKLDAPTVRLPVNY